MFCRSLFGLLSFFFWPLCCLSFFFSTINYSWKLYHCIVYVTNDECHFRIEVKLAVVFFHDIVYVANDECHIRIEVKLAVVFFHDIVYVANDCYLLVLNY